MSFQNSKWKSNRKQYWTIELYNPIPHITYIHTYIYIYIIYSCWDNLCIWIVHHGLVKVLYSRGDRLVWMDGSDYLESTFQDGRKCYFAICSHSHPISSLLWIRESSSTFSVCSTLTLMESKRLCMPWPLLRVLVVVSLWLCARRPRSISRDGFYFIQLVFIFSAGELSNDEIEKLIAVISTPLQFDIPEWFLNRQKDVETGKYRQVVSNNLQANLREDLNRLKKMR